MFEHAELLVIDAVNWICLGVESVGAAVIAIGIVVALHGFLRGILRRDEQYFTGVRLSFARYLALGLEFQLAADILSTAVAPTWDQLGKLATIAIIRTGLNFFLMHELRELHDGARHDGAKKEPPVARGFLRSTATGFTPSRCSLPGPAHAWARSTTAARTSTAPAHRR